jgi:hypothetical protein
LQKASKKSIPPERGKNFFYLALMTASLHVAKKRTNASGKKFLQEARFWGSFSQNFYANFTIFLTFIDIYMLDYKSRCCGCVTGPTMLFGRLAHAASLVLFLGLPAVVVVYGFFEDFLDRRFQNCYV